MRALSAYLAAALALVPALALAAEQAPGALEPQSYGWLLVKALGGLALVLGVLLALYWLLRRMGPGTAAAGGGNMSLLGRLPLGGRKSLGLVEVAGKVLVIGVAEQSVNLITTIDDPQEVEALKRSRPTFAGLMRRAAGKREAGS